MLKTSKIWLARHFFEPIKLYVTLRIRIDVVMRKVYSTETISIISMVYSQMIIAYTIKKQTENAD